MKRCEHVVPAQNLRCPEMGTLLVTDPRKKHQSRTYRCASHGASLTAQDWVWKTPEEWQAWIS